MIEQAIDRSIESLCERIPNLVLRDLGPLTIAIQNLCIAKAALTGQQGENLATELAELTAAEDFHNLANLWKISGAALKL